MNDALARDPRRRPRHAALPAHAPALEAGRADRRQVPAHRHPDQQLPQLGPAPHLRADAVQLREPQQAPHHDVQVRRLHLGLRHGARGRADRGQPRVVPGHGRRRAPEPAAPAQPPQPRGADPLGRPALPDGLPEDAGDPPPPRGRRHGGGAAGERRADARLRHPEGQPPGPHRALRGEARRPSGSPTSSPRSPATARASSPRWASTSSGARRSSARSATPRSSTSGAT